MTDDTALPMKGEFSVGLVGEWRSWIGLYRHALMTCIAFAYLRHLRLAQHRQASRGKMPLRIPGPPPSPNPPRLRQAIMHQPFAHLAAPV
ncbi:hypothetical protein [Roseomonas xinghualingensis]|uniref:hypothetical protein n=1 Tax=Roseomonas xinghualingensis TaxID=2986475 RepID=UPI0021F1E012|nr:hypothetical protein [Roseomonas sp. SXEYE001]MCV4208176.1 hypothetical protein [Roseomonas sp. SXEYE001]